MINLTKHIQLQSSGVLDFSQLGHGEDTSPAFMWVVRDFALALKDKAGDSISSVEYLEHALAESDGSSE